MLAASRKGIRVLAVLGAALALTITGPGIANANKGGVPAIPLNTEQAGSNTEASGFFSYDISGDQFCYKLSVRNLSVPATAAHIHLAPRHVAGPLVIPLTVGSGTNWTVDTCTTVDPTLLEAVAASPRSYYVNVHTPTFPGGEIRGQLK